MRVHRLAPLLEQYLREHGPCTSYDMAEALGVKPRSVTKAMTQLVRKRIALRVAADWTTNRTMWDLNLDDGNPPPIRRSWLGVGQWRLPRRIPRTSVFDTGEFTKEPHGQARQQ